MDVALDEGLRIPAASVNAMRRQCLDGITSQRRLAPKRREGAWQPGPRRLEPTAPPGRIYQVQRVEQLSAALLVTRPEYIYLPLDQCAAHLDRCAALEQAGIRVGAVLPRILFDSQWPEALEQVERLQKSRYHRRGVHQPGPSPSVGAGGYGAAGRFRPECDEFPVL